MDETWNRGLSAKNNKFLPANERVRREISRRKWRLKRRFLQRRLLFLVSKETKYYYFLFPSQSDKNFDDYRINYFNWREEKLSGMKGIERVSDLQTGFRTSKMI